MAQYPGQAILDTLNGTLEGGLPGGPPAQVSSPGPEGPLGELLAGLREMKSENDPEDKRGYEIKLKVGSDGKTIASLVGPGETALQLFGDASKWKEAVRGYAEQTARREAQVRGNPVLSGLTAIAGNLAAGDETLPGWVRGLGRASLQMNPSADQLAQQRMGYEQLLAQEESRDEGRNLTLAQLLLGQQEKGDERELERRRVAVAEAAQKRQDATAESQMRMARATYKAGINKDVYDEKISPAQAADLHLATGENIPYEILESYYADQAKRAAEIKALERSTDFNDKKRLEELKSGLKKSEDWNKELAEWTYRDPKAGAASGSDTTKKIPVYLQKKVEDAADVVRKFKEISEQVLSNPDLFTIQGKAKALKEKAIGLVGFKSDGTDAKMRILDGALAFLNRVNRVEQGLPGGGYSIAEKVMVDKMGVRDLDNPSESGAVVKAIEKRLRKGLTEYAAKGLITEESDPDIIAWLRSPGAPISALGNIEDYLEVGTGKPRVGLAASVPTAPPDDGMELPIIKADEFRLKPGGGPDDFQMKHNGSWADVPPVLLPDIPEKWKKYARRTK